MQCACPQCGILMGHSIHGLESSCICPECHFVCRACLGTNSIMSPEELRQYLQIYERNILESDEESFDE